MKKFLAIFLIICIALFSSVCAYAADEGITVSCGEASVTAGDTVNIPITVKNNTGFMGFSIKIVYDKNALTPVYVTPGTVISTGSLNDNISNAAPGSFKAVWSGSGNVTENGTLFIVSFKVSETALGKTDIIISYNQADTFDENWNDVIFRCVSGGVTIDNGNNPDSFNNVSSPDCNVKAGESFDFPVIFENVNGIMGCGIEITYDSEALTPVSVTRGSVFLTGLLNDNAAAAAGKLRVIWTGTQNVTSGGTAFTVRFLSSDAVADSRCVIGISYIRDDTFNESWQEITLHCSDAVVNVAGFAPNSIYSASVSASAGDTFVVPVSIKKNTGIMGFSITLEYDPDVLTPVSVSAGDILSGMFDDSIATTQPGRFKVVWTGSENMTSDGTLFTLTFKVSPTAFGAEKIRISYIAADTFDENWQNVALDCKEIPLEILNTGYTDTLHFYADPLTVQAGANAEVPIKLERANGVTSFSLNLTYDRTLLTPLAVSGGVLSNIETAEPGTLNITYDGSPISGDAAAATVIFAVREYTQGQSKIQLQCTNASSEKGEIFAAICDSAILDIVNPHISQPARIFGSRVTAVGGNLIEIPLYISNNHGIMGIGLTVSYDSDILTPISVTKGPALSGGTLDDNACSRKGGSFKIVWNNTEDVNSDGLLVTMKFTLARDVKIDSSVISVSHIKEDTYNENWEDVELNTEPITVNIDRLCVDSPASSVLVGDTLQLSASYSLGGSLADSLRWASGNNDIAVVDSNGLVTAKRRGNVIITVIDSNGNTADYYIQVLSTTTVVSILSYSGGYAQKVCWWKPYSSAKMTLGYNTYNCSEAVRYVWSSSSNRVKIDQNGNITNTGSFSRSATITLTAYDADGDVIAKDNVKVSFYKFSWQKSRLQMQSIVSDSVLQQNLSEQELKKSNGAATTTAEFIVSFVSCVFDLFKKAVFAT